MPEHVFLPVSDGSEELCSPAKTAMKTQEKLSRLAKLDGFAGAAVLTPDGRVLQKCEPTGSNIKLISALANNVLRTAEKASRDMGFGRSHFTFMQTEKTLVLMRCLNEGKNPLGSEPGKCHIHLILFIDNSNSFGMAKMEINNVIEQLAEEFRTSAEEYDLNISKVPEEGKDALKEDKGQRENLQELNSSLDHESIDSAFDNLSFSG